MAGCPICGQAVPEGERWCPNCGADILQAPGAVPVPPAAATAVEPIVQPTPAETAPPMSSAAPVPATAPAPAAPVPAPAPPSVEQTRTAVVVLPDNSELGITAVNRIFGRADFARFMSADDSAYVSRKHLSVFEEQGKFYARDEGSTNGTKVNGVDIKGKGKYELHDGDLIGVADVVQLNFRLK